MGRRIFGSALIVVALVCLTPRPAASQDRAGAGREVPPRTQWGAPDLQGVWNNNTTTPLERPTEFEGRAVLTDEERQTRDALAARDPGRDRRAEAGTPADVSGAYNDFWWEYGRSDGRTSLIVDPPDGRMPARTPVGEQRASRRRRTRDLIPAGPEDRSLYERCITRGIPVLPGAYNNNFQIVQTPNHIAILVEMIHETRVIPLDGQPHLPSGVRQYLGDSRGHWEGDTLVIETMNFTDRTTFRGSTENLRLTERLTRVGTDTLHYEITLDDEQAWARPWTALIPWTRPSMGIRGATTDTMYEYACHEGNYGMFGILSGARVEERTER